MRSTMKVALAALAITATGAAAARAELYIRNDNERSVWFTVYNPLKQGIGHGCLRSRQGVILNNAAISLGPVLFVRGEIKANADCGGRTLFDTQYGPAIPTTAGINVTRTMGPGQNGNFH